MRFVCDSCRASYRISDDKVGPKGVKVRCQKCGFVILVRRPDEEPDEALMTQVMSNPLAPMDALEEGEASLSETPAPEGGVDDDVDAALSFGDDDAPAPDAPEQAQAAPTEPAGDAAASPEGGLDPNALFGDDDEDEIGAIFDSVLNSGSQTLPGTEEDPSQVATRTMDVASMARAMDQSAASEEHDKYELTPALPSNEWFVAIEESQVGPVGIDVLREHWDRGEIGPDSLCWRAGMADWIPLSEVTELQRHLAPKPSKPAIVSTSPAPAAAGAAAVAASGAAEGAAAGGWKPSAASALASLVKDELDVISRPAPVKKQEAGSGLLDLPPVTSEPVSSPGAPAAAASMNLPLSATSAAPEPLSAPSAPAAAAPYAEIPPYQSLPPVQQKKPIGLWIGVGALVVLLLGGGVFMLGRSSGGAETPELAAAPAQQAPTPEVTAQAAAQAEEEKKAAEAAAKKQAEEEAALAKAEEEKKAEEAAAKKAEEEAALAAAEEEEEAEEKTVARRTTRRRRAPARTSSPTRTASAPTPSRTSSGSSDPFDDIFGPSGDSGSKTSKESSRPATYVPPAPSSVPAELSSSDIAQAVVSQRNALNTCVQKAKAADPGLGSGRMAMRWTIETSGRVSGLSNQTSEIRGSQLDKCVSGVIQKITFPRHRKSGGQVVTFPITF